MITLGKHIQGTDLISLRDDEIDTSKISWT